MYCQCTPLACPRFVNTHSSQGLGLIWRLGITIGGLFGQFCSDDRFRHDQMMIDRYPNTSSNTHDFEDTQATTASERLSQQEIACLPPSSVSRPEPAMEKSYQPSLDAIDRGSLAHGDRLDSCSGDIGPDCACEDPASSNHNDNSESVDIEGLQDSQDSEKSGYAFEIRMHAYYAILDNARYNTCERIGLLSTTDNHTLAEQEFDC